MLNIDRSFRLIKFDYPSNDFFTRISNLNYGCPIRSVVYFLETNSR